jgi:acetyl-CoA C-acetyltransferase
MPWRVGAGLIASGQAEVVLAGGVESVSNVPMFSDDGPLWKDLDVVRRVGSVHMGIAADLVATELGYTRDELDAYGERTQRLAREAWDRGDHDRSLLIPEGATIDRDEHVRDDVTLEALAACRRRSSSSARPGRTSSPSPASRASTGSTTSTPAGPRRRWPTARR